MAGRLCPEPQDHPRLLGHLPGRPEHRRLDLCEPQGALPRPRPSQERLQRPLQPHRGQRHLRRHRLRRRRPAHPAHHRPDRGEERRRLPGYTVVLVV